MSFADRQHKAKTPYLQVDGKRFSLREGDPTLNKTQLPQGQAGSKRCGHGLRDRRTPVALQSQTAQIEACLERVLQARNSLRAPCQYSKGNAQPAGRVRDLVIQKLQAVVFIDVLG